MADNQLALIVIIAVLVVLLVVRSTRRIVLGLLRLVVSIAAIAAAATGLAILLNGVTIYEPPGVTARVTRFLTVNQAATSKEGLSTETCVWGDEPTPTPAASPVAGAPTASPKVSPAPRPAPKAAAKSKAKPAATAAPTMTASPSPSPSPGAAEQIPEAYPELVRHGYPGLGASKIYDEALATAKSLPGWRVIANDPRQMTIDCIYTTRFFGWQDDVRIKVSRNGEVDVCSRSRVGLPGSTSMFWWFPGDFGANIGHIKEFYTVLDPRIDAIYKAEEERMQKEPPAPKYKQPSIEEFEAAPPPIELQ
jgi:hypothetical protein